MTKQDAGVSPATSEHTPGPWMVQTKRSRSAFPRYVVNSQVLGAEVAEISALLPAGEPLANARLIAAAPALLEALRATVALVNDATRLLRQAGRHNSALAIENDPELEQARAAIRLAEGSD